MRDDERSSRIDQLVDEFLVAGLGEDQIDGFCRDRSEFSHDLRDALRDAIRIRAARRRAEQPVAASEDESTGHSAEAASRDIARRIGVYTLGARLGDGGFGEVYEATTEGSDETLAIKVLRLEHGERADIVHRFRREAAILTSLGHPSIVPVHEVGEADGRLYIVMQRIRGLDLHRFSRARPIDPELAARYIAEAADACAFAHQAGVIHRDIKPENILVEESGRVVLSDFGLAKQIYSKTELTLSLQRLGTPHYMAPEQADRRLGPITERSDVYSLGATLYFLLTGRPPFPTIEGLGRDAALEQVKWDAPVPPSRHNPVVPADLETICLQCLEKWPGDRPADATALAADLRSFINGRPVSARLPGRLRRARRWCARRPLATSLLSVALAALLAGSAASIHYASRAVASEAETLKQRGETAKADRERQRREYLADMRDAQAALSRGETPIALGLLSKYESPAVAADDPRSFEWHYLRRLAQAPSPVQVGLDDGAWNRLSLSPSGDRIASIDQRGNLAVFHLPDGEPLFRHAGPVKDCAFASDGATIVALTASLEGRLSVLDATTGTVAKEFPVGLYTTAMALSPAAPTCFTGDAGGGLWLWSLENADVVDFAAGHKRGPFDRSLDIQHGAVTAAAFSPDGDSLAIGYENGATQIWDIRRRDITARGPVHNGIVTGLSFSPDGTRIASQSFGRHVPQLESNTHGEVRAWNAATGESLGVIVPHQAMLAESPFLDERLSVPFGQFTPWFTADGRELVTTGPLAVQRWNVESGRLTGQYTGDGTVIHAVAMSADGRHVAAAGASAGIRVWPTDSAAPAATLLSEDFGIRALCGDGARLAIVRENGTGMTVGEHGQLYSRSERREAVVWDLEKNTPTSTTLLPTNVNTITPIPGGFLCRDVVVGAATNPDLVKRLRGLSDSSVIAVSANGRWIAIGHDDGTVQLLTEDEATAWTAPVHQGAVTALAFAPDASVVACGGEDRRIHVLDCRTGAIVASLQGHRREIGGLAFSPDGRRLASSSGRLQMESTQPGEVRLWDWAVEQMCLELTAGPSDVYPGVAWSGDSTRLYAAANAMTPGEVAPGRVVVWDSSDRQAGPEGAASSQ